MTTFYQEKSQIKGQRYNKYDIPNESEGKNMHKPKE